MEARILTRTAARVCALAVGAALSSACFVVTDLDRYKKAPPLAPTNFSDLRVTVRGMTSHVNEMFEYRVIDNANVIQSRGRIVPLGGPAATFFVEGAVPKQNGPFHLDFFADHDNSGAYDPRSDTTLDHAWRLPLDDKQLDENGAFVIVFDHNTSFTNLNTPNPPQELGKRATVHIKGMNGFMGKRLEARIADASTRRTVAMYRVPVLTAPELDAVIDGMIETGVTYSVEIYTDDGNGGAASVQAFRFESLAAENGLEVTFNGESPTENPGAVRVPDPKTP